MAEAKSENKVKKTKSPLQLNYIKMLKLFLWLSGAWPAHLFGEHMALFFRFLRVSLPFQTSIIIISEIYYFHVHHETINFFDLGHVFLTTALALVTLARQLLPNLKTFGILIKRFIEDFHLMHYKNDGEPHYLKTYSLTNKVSYYFTMLQIVMMLLGMMLFNILPVYNNFAMGAFHYPRNMSMALDAAVFLELPGFIQNDHFIISTILNMYLSLNCGIAVSCIDLLMVLMVFQVVGHIKLLMHKVENLPRPKKSVSVMNSRIQVDLYDDDENKTAHLQLIEVVHDHRKIVAFADAISSFFGPVLALNYLFQLVGGCVLLLECSKDPRSLARFLPLTVVIFGQLIELSVSFEVVGYMSEKLIDSVYYMPWECMNVSNQRSVRFILSRTQTPLEVTAMGIVPVGVKTMLSIIKTTFSFLALLQSINE